MKTAPEVSAEAVRNLHRDAVASARRARATRLPVLVSLQLLTDWTTTYQAMDGIDERAALLAIESAIEQRLQALRGTEPE